MTVTEGARLRDEGQQQSLSILFPDDYANFDRILASYPVGTELSINTVRSQLDALEVPAAARGGLFSRAVHAGVLAPAVFVHRGREHLITEQSTGTSAHRAHVKVYVRTDPTTAGEGSA